MPENEEKQESKTFTQDEVNSLLAAEKRKASERFADYDDVKSKALKFDEFEASSRTDLEKALERASQAEARAAAYEQKEQIAAFAADIVKGSDVPAHVLRGSTREELEQHFEELKALTPAPAPVKRVSAPAGKATGDGGGSRAVAALRQHFGQQ